MESLIIPKTWVRYKITLESCVDRTDPAVERCLQLVIQRNNNLCSPAETKRNDPHISQQRRMIDTLDSVVAPFNLIELSLTCSSLLPDHTDFVQCLCEWAVTSLRVGVYRVYIAVAILRQKARAGNDIQGPILTFLERFARSVVGNKNNVYLLISELVRTKNFPLASYFKWLIARGILLPFTTMEKDHPCHVRLLAEIPISGAPQHIKNLRNSLLRGTGFSVDIEAETLQQVKNLLSKRIGGILSKQHPPPPLTAKFETGELDIIHSLSRNLISEVTTWIGGSVRRHVVEGAP